MDMYPVQPIHNAEEMNKATTLSKGTLYTVYMAGMWNREWLQNLKYVFLLLYLNSLIYWK